MSQGFQECTWRKIYNLKSYQRIFLPAYWSSLQPAYQLYYDQDTKNIKQKMHLKINLQTSKKNNEEAKVFINIWVIHLSLDFYRNGEPIKIAA